MCNHKKFFEAFKAHLPTQRYPCPVFQNCVDRNIPFSFQILTDFTLSNLLTRPDFASPALLPSLCQPPLLTAVLLGPWVRLDCTSSVARSGDEGTEQLRITQPQALGKRSCLQRAIVGRDPVRKGEKSRTFSVTHLTENLLYQQDIQEWKLYILIFSRAMPTASFSTLQGNVRVAPCGTQIVLSQVPTCTKGTWRGPCALHRTGPQQITKLRAGTGTRLILSSSCGQMASHAGTTHCLDTSHFFIEEFITKDSTCVKQLVHSLNSHHDFDLHLLTRKRNSIHI